MNEKPYMKRVEDVLDAMGLRTFDSPMKLEYRFGSFDAEEGPFRTFVREEDAERTMGYLEIKGDTVFFVMLEYPGFDETINQIEALALKCRKTLGRHHTAMFILAVENDASKDKHRIIQTVDSFQRSRTPGVYYTIEIWDEDGLQAAEKKYSPQNV